MQYGLRVKFDFSPIMYHNSVTFSIEKAQFKRKETHT